MEHTVLASFYNELIIKQDYFECHEIAEDYWKSKQTFQKDDAEVFLVQISTGEYHYRRGNLKGAEKCYLKAKKLLHTKQYNLEQLGLTEDIYEFLSARLDLIIEEAAFTPPHLPLNQHMLNSLYVMYGQDLEEQAFIDSITTRHVTHQDIVDKHLLRDRTSVNKAREAAIQARQKNRM